MHKLNKCINRKEKMRDTISTIVTGATGVGAVQIADNIPTADDIQGYGQLFIQLVIGVLTIWKMFRRKKQDAVSDTPQNQ